MDREQFSAACQKVMGTQHQRGGIGTLGEKTLHAVLKHYFEPYEDNHETNIGGYVADIVGEHGIMEIQTRNFDRLRKKLDVFLSVTTVTVVYPIPRTKWLIWIDPDTGEAGNRRKSPKTGTPCEAFQELYKIKSLLTHPNLRLLLVLLDVEEYRNLDGWSKDKKKGSTRYERIPIALVDEIEVNSVWEYNRLIPEGLAEKFTVKDFRKASRLSQRGAGTALNVLRSVGAVKCVDKQGNAFVYERAI
ncbi:MAG: hypothetical protein RSF86_01220 [Angelakisella sp.]